MVPAMGGFGLVRTAELLRALDPACLAEPASVLSPSAVSLLGVPWTVCLQSVCHNRPTSAGTLQPVATKGIAITGGLKLAAVSPPGVAVK